jgi:hypothetical protein
LDVRASIRPDIVDEFHFVDPALQEIVGVPAELRGQLMEALAWFLITSLVDDDRRQHAAALRILSLGDLAEHPTVGAIVEIEADAGHLRQQIRVADLPATSRGLAKGPPARRDTLLRGSSRRAYLSYPTGYLCLRLRPDLGRVLLARDGRIEHEVEGRSVSEGLARRDACGIHRSHEIGAAQHDKPRTSPLARQPVTR